MAKGLIIEHRHLSQDNGVLAVAPKLLVPNAMKGTRSLAARVNFVVFLKETDLDNSLQPPILCFEDHSFPVSFLPFNASLTTSELKLQLVP
jgi:hypothetical protein